MTVSGLMTGRCLPGLDGPGHGVESELFEFLLTLTDHQTIVNVTLMKVNHSYLFSMAQGMTVD